MPEVTVEVEDVTSLKARLTEIEAISVAKKELWNQAQRNADAARSTANSAFEDWTKSLDNETDLIRKIHTLEST